MRSLARPLAHGAAARLDGVELGQMHDVDQHIWPGEPHVEHRRQRLAAGEDARVGAGPRKLVERLVQRRRRGAQREADDCTVTMPLPDAFPVLILLRRAWRASAPQRTARTCC